MIAGGAVRDAQAFLDDRCSRGLAGRYGGQGGGQIGGGCHGRGAVL